MPDPRPRSHPLPGVAITRREGLVGLLALGGLGSLGMLTACSAPAQTAQSSTAAGAAAPVSPTVADELGLIARYDATIASFPALAATLKTIRDQHVEHLSALGGPAPAGSSAGPSGGAVSLPTDPRAAVGSLIDAERTAMRQRIEACAAATDPEAARTLVFIAASEGAHIPALKGVQP